MTVPGDPAEYMGMGAEGETQSSGRGGSPCAVRCAFTSWRSLTCPMFCSVQPGCQEPYRAASSLPSAMARWRAL